ncbi:cytochrome c biogenesis protein ResB [soil metagenome]
MTASTTGASTTGIEVRAKSRHVRDAVELVSSMRFSISLLTVICIASVIGTVVKQHEPIGNYVNQFGPFWAQVFNAVDLYTVYSAWWFLLILAFLVASTSLCIARNAPKILVDLRTYKESMREESLKSFHHKGQGVVGESPQQALQRVVTLLGNHGWKAKVQVRDKGTMVAARAGGLNKIGYLAAHGAIVLICLGGLSDGDLIVKAQMMLQGKSSYGGGGLIRDVPASHRLSTSTPTFRGNLLVPEGGRAGTAIISMSDGVVLQDLPFDIELKKFVVEYYETGMPKLFASDIVIHDRDTGEAIAATVKVNQPAFHRGVAIYQSSFDDGGSTMRLRAIPMTAGGKSFELDGVVGSSTTLSTQPSTGSDAAAPEKLSLEFTGLRVINVENMSAQGGASGQGASATDVRKVDLMSSLQNHMGSGAKGGPDKSLRNVGPSISYKLRDASGQAREYNNYMLPVELDGQRVFLAGVRDQPDQAFRYLRIPADDEMSIMGWTRLREALSDPVLREKAADRYVALATPTDRPEMAAQLKTTAMRVLGLFAGVEPVTPTATSPSAASQPTSSPAAPEPAKGGLQAIADFMEASVPESDRQRISDVLLRILNGSLFELTNLTREAANIKPLVPDESTQQFMTQSVLSLSDSYLYPAPVLLELTNFTQVQASVFQVTRSPGKTVVYIGCVLLIIGVFSMLYVRERRLWVWLQGVDNDASGSVSNNNNGTAPSQSTRITTAMSTTRRTLDGDADFDRLAATILKGSA